MFFYLSKIFMFVIKPFNLIAVALILSFTVKPIKWRKRMRVSALVMFIFFTNGFIQNELLLLWEKKAIPLEDIQSQYEVGIVLGGTADSEREPYDRLFFIRGAERITHAVNLYKAGKIRKNLIYGRQGIYF